MSTQEVLDSAGNLPAEAHHSPEPLRPAVPQPSLPLSESAARRASSEPWITALTHGPPDVLVAFHQYSVAQEEVRQRGLIESAQLEAFYAGILTANLTTIERQKSVQLERDNRAILDFAVHEVTTNDHRRELVVAAERAMVVAEVVEEEWSHRLWLENYSSKEYDDLQRELLNTLTSTYRATVSALARREAQAAGFLVKEEFIEAKRLMNEALLEGQQLRAQALHHEASRLPLHQWVSSVLRSPRKLEMKETGPTDAVLHQAIELVLREESRLLLNGGVDREEDVSSVPRLQLELEESLSRQIIIAENASLREEILASVRTSERRIQHRALNETVEQLLAGQIAGKEAEDRAQHLEHHSIHLLEQLHTADIKVRLLEESNEAKARRLVEVEKNLREAHEAETSRTAAAHVEAMTAAKRMLEDLQEQLDVRTTERDQLAMKGIAGESELAALYQQCAKLQQELNTPPPKKPVKHVGQQCKTVLAVATGSNTSVQAEPPQTRMNDVSPVLQSTSVHQLSQTEESSAQQTPARVSVATGSPRVSPVPAVGPTVIPTLKYPRSELKGDTPAELKQYVESLCDEVYAMAVQVELSAQWESSFFQLSSAEEFERMELLSLQRSEIILHLISDGNRREQEWKEREAAWKAQNDELFQSRLAATTSAPSVAVDLISSSQQTDKLATAGRETPTRTTLHPADGLAVRDFLSGEPSPARGSRGPSPLVFASEEARMAFINQLFSPDSPYVVVRKESIDNSLPRALDTEQEEFLVAQAHPPSSQMESQALFPSAKRNQELSSTELPTLLISPVVEKERSSAAPREEGLVVFNPTNSLQAGANADIMSSVSGRGSSIGDDHYADGVEVGGTAPKTLGIAVRGRGFGAGLSDVPSADVSTLGDDEILAML